MHQKVSVLEKVLGVSGPESDKKDDASGAEGGDKKGDDKKEDKKAEKKDDKKEEKKKNIKKSAVISVFISFTFVHFSLQEIDKESHQDFHLTFVVNLFQYL